jgi:nucleoside 2-deoxyribosyltransferase
MSKPKVYIAGPMRGYKNFNFDAFDAARAEVSALGYHPISPADMDRLYEGWGKYPPADFVPTKEDRIRFMRRDLAAIEESDAIYLLEGFEDSTGALDEMTHADFIGLELIYQENVRTGIIP